MCYPAGRAGIGRASPGQSSEGCRCWCELAAAEHGEAGGKVKAMLKGSHMVKGIWFHANSVLPQRPGEEDLLEKELAEQRYKQWCVVRGTDAVSLNMESE